MAGIALGHAHPDQLVLDEVRHWSRGVDFSREGKLVRVSARGDVAHLEFFRASDTGAPEFVAGISCELDELLQVGNGGSFQASEADRFLLVQPLADNIWLVFSAPEIGYNESALVDQSLWREGLELLRRAAAAEQTTAIGCA